MTPYAKLRSLDDAASYLKPGVSFALLDAVATAETDFEAAQRVRAEQRDLFQRIASRSGAAPHKMAG